MTKSDATFGILIIGFNRPDFLIERVQTLQEVDLGKTEVFISLDFPRNENSSDLSSHREIINRLEILKKDFDFHLFVERSNQGCDKHIPSAISKVLKKCDGVLVIEDDIVIPNGQIKSILALANANFMEFKTNPIVSMSGIYSGHFTRRNKWRETQYFTAWGYFLFEGFWNSHKQLLESFDYPNEDSLKESNLWRHLSERQRKLWRERFSRQHYDYLIQRSIFALDLKVYAPVFRVANNLGFGDRGAVHTRFSSPYYLRRTVKLSSTEFRPVLVKIDLLSKFLVFLDSNTWAGDGWLSKRGRTMGIRTLTREVLTNVRRFRVGKDHS
jgi:hypothetical protein